MAIKIIINNCLDLVALALFVIVLHFISDLTIVLLENFRP